MSAEATLETRKGPSVLTVLVGIGAVYAVLDLTEVWSGAVSGDSSDTILESKSFSEAKEALRTKAMALEHIFGGGGGTGGAPDPEDDEGFSRFIARAVLYGGVAAALAKKLALGAPAISRWANQNSRPPRYARPTVMKALREVIEEMFGSKK